MKPIYLRESRTEQLRDDMELEESRSSRLPGHANKQSDGKGKRKVADAVRQHIDLRARHGSLCDDSSALEVKQVEER